MQIHSLQSLLHGRRVSLSESVAADLRMLAIEGLTALRRRGLEVGGILLGHASIDELRVESFQEVPCEHRYGPSYVLSDADRENLTSLLEQLRGVGEWQVIGAFRSFTGRDPVIESADEALVAGHFPHGDFVLLFLQPLSPENCVTTFHLFHDGRLLSPDEQPRLVLPPKPAPEPDPAPFLAPKPIVADEAPMEPAPEDSGEPLRLSGPPTEPEIAPRRPAMWKTALICMAVVLAGSFAYELGRAHRPVARAVPEWAELNLDTRPAGGKLEVRWDASVARALQATRGSLAISDGGSPREIELGAAQVGAGRYTYAAERPDVTIRLTLFAGDRMVASELARLTPRSPVTPPPETSPAPTSPSRPITPPPAAAAASGKVRPEVPPSAVHEVQPVVPEGIRSRVTEPIVIDVELQLNDHGRVTHAKAKAPGADGLHRYLAGLAEKAALEWRFTPARTREGSPVAAGRTIRFVFTSTR